MQKRRMMNIACLTPLALAPLVMALGMSTAHAAANPCDPLNYGAIGDGIFGTGNGTFGTDAITSGTDNTAAIQSAINACASAGGGTVPLSVVNGQGVYLTGPITLASHVLLLINRGVTLAATNDQSRYVAAFINWVYQPNEALISAVGAVDVGIIGAGTIDGGGGALQPDGGPSWWTQAAGFATGNTGPTNSFGVAYYLNPFDVPTSNGMPRPFLLEFYQCSNVVINGVTLQNAPMWHQGLRFSDNINETGVTVNAPNSSPNTDGVDVVGSTNVTLANLHLSDGDDDIAIKSGLPVNPNSPNQVGIPQMATSNVIVTNITAGTGHGISVGSEASNGVNHVLIQNVTYTGTSDGFRIKTGRDRGNEIYDISLNSIRMTNVALPLSINAYYPASGGPTEPQNPPLPPYDPAQPVTATTPYVHDITIQNFTATGATSESIIEGLPESCIQRANLSNVSIQTSNKGIALRHMTGVFTNVISTPGSGGPFVVQENVTVVTAGTTPAITNTPPQTGQTPCSAQVVPPS
jgi:polygalacturonase